MHYSVFMEDCLEFDDWHDQDNEEVNFNDSSSEERLIAKLKSDDHYFRKQGLNDLLLFMQQNTHIDIFPSVFDAVKRFSTDSEPSLRSDFAESLITITQIGISKNFTEWNCIENFTVPSVISLLHDTNKQIRLTSHSTIVFMIENKIITKELFFAEIYPTLEEMMVSYNPDELRSECFTLIVQISQLLPYSLEESLLGFCHEFINANDNLRKTCASYLLNMINGSSDKHLNDWLEIFYKLSDDNSWYVKKFCIECAVSLSRRVSRDERWNKMTNAYYNFMTDSKKWVSTCAYQNFGAFIASFSDPCKALCEVSEQSIVHTHPAVTPSTITNIAPSSTTDIDSNFTSFCYWQQPINDSLVPQLSPMTLSICDIDLNQSDSSDLAPYCWPPDLSNYKQEIVPPKLLQSYSNVIHEGVDVDLIRPCAFSMPAVLVTLGPSCWPYLKAPYTKLVQFMSWKVRLSLAASLHHVFQIFRYNDSAIDDLISAYKELIKDVDEVKCGLMAHISQFYLAMAIDRYPMIFEDFHDLVHLDSVKNWRYRVTCMEQLQLLVTGIDVKTHKDRTIFTQMLNNRWLPIVFKFTEDQVWLVRSAAADVLIATLKKLVHTNSVPVSGDGGDNGCVTSYDTVIKVIEDKIVQLSESKCWYLRQLFLHSAVKVVVTDVVSLDTLDSVIMPKYLYLCCWDGVPNNRMVGGHGLEQICFHEYFTLTSDDSRKLIENVYRQLCNDKDRDVRQSVERLRAVFVTD